MKRILVLVTVVAGATAGVLLIQQLNEQRQYRRLVSEGEQALSAGATYAAIEAFTRALVFRPASMVAHYRRGEAYGLEGRDDRARADLRRAHDLAPDAPAPLTALGRLSDRAGNPREAAAWYAEASNRLENRDPSLLYVLALARYRAGDAAGARVPLRQAIALHGSMAEAHYLLGLVLRDSRQALESLASLEQAVRLAPDLVAAREELADLYRELGREDDQSAQLQALAGIERDADRYLALARAQLARGLYDAALASLTDARQTTPNDSRIALATGRVHLSRVESTGDRDALPLAMSELERALGGTARRSEGLALYGRGLFLSGDLPASEQLLRDAILTTPVDPEAFRFLADTAERLQHPDVARDALISLDALEGDTAPKPVRVARARRIGVLALDASDYDTSIKFLKLVAGSVDPDPAALGLLARALWQTGRHDEARDTLGRARALAPAAPDLARLARTIR